jgi:hypothetical protein
MKAGTYNATLTALAFGRSDTGTDQVGLAFDCEGADGEPAGSITAYRYFTEKAMDFAIADLQTLGWKGDSLSELMGDPPAVSLLGAKAELKIQMEEYKGESRPRVLFINAPGGGVRMKNALDAAGATSLAQRVRARMLLKKQSGGAPMKATGTDGAPPVDPDDIPF